MIRALLFWMALLVIAPLSADEIQLPLVKRQQIYTAAFNQPTSVAVAENGRVYVLDGMNNQIVIFSDTGEKLNHIQGDKNNIPDFSRSVGLFLHQDQLYIADAVNNRIIIISDQGALIKTIPLSATPPLRYPPEPIAVNRIQDKLFYSDRRNHQVCIIHLQRNDEQQCFGKRGEEPGDFQFPFQIAVDRDEYLHIVDVINGRVQVFNSRGQYFSQEGKFAVDVLYRPNGIAIDALGYQYVSDAYRGTIAVFYRGRYITELKSSDGKVVKFKTPVGMTYGSKGLYVVDAATDQVFLLQLDYHQFARSDVIQAQQSAELSRKNCVACHFSWGFAEDKALEDEQGVAPVAALDMCYSCHHGVVFESRHAIPHKGQHPTVYDNAEKKQKRQDGLPRDDEIPEGHPLLKDGEMTCTACHTPHNADLEQPTLYVENNNSWMRILNKESDLCENCHESKKETALERQLKKRGKNHPLGFKLVKSGQRNKLDDFSEDPHLQKGLPSSLHHGGAVLGKEAKLICQSCHQIHGGEGDYLMAVTDQNGAVCAACHKRQSPTGKKGARKAGVHPVNVKLEEPVQFRGKKTSKVICQSCHEVHDGTIGTPLFPDKIRDAEKLCVDCHERHHAKDTKEALKKGIHPINEKLDEAVKIGGKTVKNMGCLSCHSIHNGKRNTPALLEDHKNGQLCEHCHEGKQMVVGTDHDFRVTAKKAKNRFKETAHQSGVCGSCHTLHKGKGKQPYLYSAVIAKKKDRDDGAPKLKVDELCMNCHQDDAVGKDKPIYHYGHPYQNIIMRSAKEVMPVVNPKTGKIDKIGAIACITCHEPHSWKPNNGKPVKGFKPPSIKGLKNQEGDVLNSFLLRKGVAKTFCVDCHSIEGLSKYKYYHHEKKVRDIGVDYLK